MRQFAAMTEAQFKKSFTAYEKSHGRTPNELELDRVWAIYQRVYKREG